MSQPAAEDMAVVVPYDTWLRIADVVRKAPCRHVPDDDFLACQGCCEVRQEVHRLTYGAIR